MGEVKPVSRRDRAAATRWTIIEAATAEFVERGYQGTTMAAIAARAGVATQTVYFVFHTKAKLLTGCIDAAVMARGAPPHLTAWYREATTTQDAARAITAFVEGSTEILTRAGAIVQAARGAAASDPDLEEELARNEQLRNAGYRQFVTTLADRGLLADVVTEADATNLLLLLVAPSTFVEATQGLRWDADQFSNWMARLLTAALVRPQ